MGPGNILKCNYILRLNEPDKIFNITKQASKDIWGLVCIWVLSV